MNMMDKLIATIQIPAAYHSTQWSGLVLRVKTKVIDTEKADLELSRQIMPQECV